MGVCENQVYPPASVPTRVAYLTYKNLQTNLHHCQYGVQEVDGTPADCHEVPADAVAVGSPEAQKYRPEVLSSCVCTPGTHCQRVIANAGVWASPSPGWAAELWGCLGSYGGSHHGAMELSVLSRNYTLIRFFIGCVGATFVTNQFWCSLMFAPNVVGTANATAAGWGNLGGGVTQIFMMSVLFTPMVNAGLDHNTAWRVAMLVPAVVFLLCALALKLCCWDTPTCKRFDVTVIGKTKKPSLRDYVEVLKDVRVVIMIFQYSAFLALVFEAIFLFAFGRVDHSQPWYVALGVLVCFSLFVQMAEGTSYGIVPFMKPDQLAVVSAVVGAGGNLGAVIAGVGFYQPIHDALLPFQVHAGYVLFWALLSPFYYWPDKGGMFQAPKALPAASKSGIPSSEETASTVATCADVIGAVVPVGAVESQSSKSTPRAAERGGLCMCAKSLCRL
ncbi:NRT2.5 [Symbiodinium necroappetens]|uniref:NRT2.5 protein n=1 Tax=Symbiodinium necroappetens TaxID=1628268 RepID=A0A812QM31_9DINO|nr:NRT2.5 [Symbiodinium necroappetens]